MARSKAILLAKSCCCLSACSALTLIGLALGQNEISPEAVGFICTGSISSLIALGICVYKVARAKGEALPRRVTTELSADLKNQNAVDMEKKEKPAPLFVITVLPENSNYRTPASPTFPRNSKAVEAVTSSSRTNVRSSHG